MKRPARKFAEGTSTPVSSSVEELRRIVRRYGADQIITGEAEDRIVFGFTAEGRQVRFVVPRPESCPAGEERRLWRCLVLVIKSKLESVATGIEEFEDAFLANIVTPSGRLVRDEIRPRLAEAYETGRTPPLLPDYSDGEGR